jgi:hypothetical protein
MKCERESQRQISVATLNALSTMIDRTDELEYFLTASREYIEK